MVWQEVVDEQVLIGLVSSNISILLIPLASEAVVVILTEPLLGKVEPLAGVVIVTVGGVRSELLGTGVAVGRIG